MKTIIVPSPALSRLDNLKRLWCIWNGQKGTPKQLARIRLTEADLVRMLAERGVRLAD